VDVDVDVVLLHAGHLGLDLVLAIGFLDVETDLECAVTLATARDGLEETTEQLGKHLGERVVNGKSGHRITPSSAVWPRQLPDHRSGTRQKIRATVVVFKTTLASRS